jgi:Ca2+-binding RTX toxin-like protein
MMGGAGDDVYVVNDQADAIIEQPGGGIDTIHGWSSVFGLPANVENLSLFGKRAHTVMGNDLDNLIVGSDANDTIRAESGDDIIHAGRGASVLYGGDGEDMFVFSALGKGTTIKDFNLGDDMLDLRPLMDAIGYNGTDPVADRVVSFGGTAANGTQVMIDHDGAGAGPAHLLATLDQVLASAFRPGVDAIW